MEEKVRRRQEWREEEDDGQDQTASFCSLHLHLLEFVNGSQLLGGWAFLVGKLGFLLVGCLAGCKMWEKERIAVEIYLGLWVW